MPEHLEARLNALDSRLEVLDARLAAMERGGYDHRISALETELKLLRTDIGEILRVVHSIELQERDRENTMLRDILRVALAAGTGGGAVGTTVYAILKVLST